MFALIALLAIVAVPGRASAAPTTYDDNDPRISFGGNWGAKTGIEGRYNSTTHETSQATAYAAYAFDGTAFTLVGEQQPWGGAADLFVDGVLQQTVSFNGSSALQQAIYTGTGLAAGKHIVKLVAKGTGWVYVDALRIEGTLQAPPPPDPVNLPDLIVTEVTFSPAQPYAGDAVRFSMVVKNQGAAPTPDGVVVGGIFVVNGQMVSYTDTYKTSIKPGEAVTLVANGGGTSGNGTWKAQEGSWTIGALVDDVNRIAESNENNNAFTRSAPLSVTALNGPDLVAGNITWEPVKLRAGHRIVFSATVTNIGNQPTPAGATVGLQFTVDGQAISSGASTSPLAPGQSVVLTAETGPAGKDNPTWVAAPGAHSVRAIADPANLIAESREGNNAETIDFAVDQASAEAAKPADALVDSIGVATHLGYTDTSYGDYAGIFKPRIQESGIRHIRDGTDLSNTEVIAKLNDLAAIGVKSTLLTDPRKPASEAVAVMKATKPSVEAVEGPNEVNIFYGDLFPEAIRTYQRDLYTAIKSDPATAALPVLAPSLAYGREDSAKLGPVPCDLGNIHSYPGGQLPDAGIDLRAADDVCPGKPVMATETGYNTAVNATSGQRGVSEAAAAKYMPRVYLEHFIRGVRRTFAYEFLDEKPNPDLTDPEQHFGMVRNDGTPKASFTAIKNLIALLADPGAAFTPGTLGYTLSGNTTNLRHTLLQKRDGTYYLVLWLNARSYNLDTNTDAAVPTQSITLTFDGKFRPATTYRPSSGTNATNVGGSQTLTLDVPDEPLVLKLTPRR
jgi:hypothetical protein